MMKQETVGELRRMVRAKLPRFVDHPGKRVGGVVEQNPPNSHRHPPYSRNTPKPCPSLPPSLLHQIFLRLRTPDLKTCTLVCRTWCLSSSNLLFRAVHVQPGRALRLAFEPPLDPPEDSNNSSIRTASAFGLVRQRFSSKLKFPARERLRTRNEDSEDSEFKRFALAVRAPAGTLTRARGFAGTVRCLMLCGVLDTASFRTVVRELKVLREVHFDEVVFTVVPARRRTVIPIPWATTSTNATGGDRKGPRRDGRIALDKLVVREPDLSVLLGSSAPQGSPRNTLWSVSLLCFSSVDRLELTCSLPGPGRTSVETILELKRHLAIPPASTITANAKVKVRTLQVGGITSAFLDTADILQHVVDFSRLEALKLDPFMVLIDSSWLCRFFEAHGNLRSLVELYVKYERDNIRDPRFVNPYLDEKPSLHALQKTLSSACPSLRRLTLHYAIGGLSPARTQDLAQTWNEHTEAFLRAAPALEDLTIVVLYRMTYLPGESHEAEEEDVVMDLVRCMRWGVLNELRGAGDDEGSRSAGERRRRRTTRRRMAIKFADLVQMEMARWGPDRRRVSARMRRVFGECAGLIRDQLSPRMREIATITVVVF